MTKNAINVHRNAFIFASQNRGSSVTVFCRSRPNGGRTHQFKGKSP